MVLPLLCLHRPRSVQSANLLVSSISMSQGKVHLTLDAGHDATPRVVEEQKIKYTGLKDFNKECFNGDVSRVPFHLADAFDDVDDIFCVHEWLLKKVTNMHAPIKLKEKQVRSVFDDVSAEILYDVLHDPDYRKTWDHSMLEGYEICAINPNNDIGYYAMRSPPPLRNRDFVTQRSWLDLGKEKCIFNHSVNHAQCPPKKGFIRGISFFTGYVVRPLDDRKCQFTYVSHSDPRGKLPAWVVNKATKILAPKIIARIYKASKNYEKWKSSHNPHFKPWLYPEQMTLPRLDMSQIKPLSAGVSSESIDESGVGEEEIDEDDI